MYVCPHAHTHRRLCLCRHYVEIITTKVFANASKNRLMLLYYQLTTALKMPIMYAYVQVNKYHGAFSGGGVRNHDDFIFIQSYNHECRIGCTRTSMKNI